MLLPLLSLIFLLVNLVLALPTDNYSPDNNVEDTAESNGNITLLQTRAGPIAFQGCNGVMSALNDDLADMVTMASKARDNVGPSNSFYSAVFGKDPNQSNVLPDKEIKSRFDAIASATTSAKGNIPTVRCDYYSNPDARCQIRTRAPAMTQGSGSTRPTIWLCAGYWANRLRIRDIALPRYGSRMPLDPYIPTAGLLLHEWTHALFETTDVKLKNNNAGQIAYGQQNVLYLQQETSGARRSRNNADSYRIFAAMVTMNGRWSTDPNNLGGHIELKRRDKRHDEAMAGLTVS